MKSSFSEYYSPCEAQIRALWDEAIFCFDTNVLLGLYRCPAQSQNNFLDILCLLKDRVWLPHQACLEYHDQRLSVIRQQVKLFGDIENTINTSLSRIIELSNIDHLSISGSQIENIMKEAGDKVTELLKKDRASHPDLIKEDFIRDKLVAIFDGKTGSPYTETDLKKIYSIGEWR